MRRLLHISDLHFGRDRPELVEPLIAQINALAPDLVAISGDFTQRARRAQYAEAAAFLRRLQPPVLAVPGNHDTPIHDPYRRFIRPWSRYRRYISPELEPTWEDAEMAVVGVNTVNRFAWQSGRIGRHTVRRACRAFGPDARERDGGRMHILVLHHPLEQSPESTKAPTRGAEAALAELGACGADIILSGHLHAWRAEPFEAQREVLLVQAGTGLSTRKRGEPNDFNLLTIEGDDLQIERFAAGDRARFDSIGTTRFQRAPSGWTQPVGDAPGDEAGESLGNLAAPPRRGAGG